MIKSFLARFKKPKYYIPTTVVVLILVWVIFFRNGGGVTSYIDVKRGTVTQEVAITGKTKAVSSVDMSFERGGKVAYAPVSVGSRVVAGQALVSLDQSELVAQLTQAQASLAAQEAKLAEVKRGSRPEDLAVSKSKVDSAQVSLDSATRDLMDGINSAYSQADDAIHNHADKFFVNPETYSPDLRISFFNNNNEVIFAVDNTDLKVSLNNTRVGMSDLLKTWKIEINKGGDLTALAKSSRGHAEKVRSFLDDLSLAINSIVANDFAYQTTINGYKSDIAGARVNMSSAVSGLNANLEKMASAQTGLITINNEYGSQRAGSTKEAIAAQEAQVMQAQGQVDLINAQIGKGSLVAPIAGVVTKREFELGENIMAGANILSIITDSDLEIEANVPEVDIGKVSVGNPVAITLDAFPGEEFTGKVTYIDPAETLVDGVVNFKIKVVFDKADPRLKSGLTANLNIKTLIKNNVLLVPQYALVENDQGTFVRTGSGNNTKDILVKVGVRGLDGSIEIISGVKEGDKVINIGTKVK